MAARSKRAAESPVYHCPVGVKAMGLALFLFGLLRYFDVDQNVSFMVVGLALMLKGFMHKKKSKLW